MIGFLIKKIVGSKNDREVRKLRPLVAQINEIEATLQSKPEEHLREKTAEWKTRCAAIQDKDELRTVLDEILPEAFFTTAKASGRISSSTVRNSSLSWMAAQRVFHSAVFSRRCSSGFDCNVASISLICATRGRSFRTSRSFFEPTIFLMRNPIMRTVSKQTRNATGCGGWRQKELG